MLNILIVDDHAANVVALESALERENIKLYSTTFPKLALRMCVDHAIDMALIDVNMPEYSGYDLLQALKSNPVTEAIMVVLITGYSMDSTDVVKGLSLGAVDYLFKPLDLYITMAKVDAIIKLIYQQRDIHNKNSQLEQYQKRLLEAISTTEQSKIAKENFFANMSHEIRTPLNAIMGLVHILEASGLTKEQSEVASLLSYSSNVLLGLVNDILDISRIDAGKVKITKTDADLKALIDNVCNSTRPLAESKGLKLNCVINIDGPVVILADLLRLNQILINLLNNAIKFTTSGSVNLVVSIIERQNTRALLEFSVSDTGIGIPQESLSDIFRQYEKLENNVEDRFGSSGLGLAIVKKLIELKGGQLQVESKVGEGSTFIFTNWYEVRTEITEVVKPQRPFLKPFHGVSILLVDDNQINRFVTHKILTEWNIQVDEAENGLDAFNKAQLNRYHMILMDIHMPLLNGIEATLKIRKESSMYNKSIPIIGFSASIIEQDRIDGKAAGINDFMQKPFTPADLHTKISTFIN